MPGLPLVVIPHPIAGNFADLVRQKAEAVADEVLEVLTGSERTLTERYQGRFTKPAERKLSAEAVCTDTVCAVDLTRPE